MWWIQKAMEAPALLTEHVENHQNVVSIHGDGFSLYIFSKIYTYNLDTSTLKRPNFSAPVLLPRKFHGWRSLVGYSPWGHKELDMTEQLHLITCFSPDSLVVRRPRVLE